MTKTAKSFEVSLQRLDELVAMLERNDQPLDKTLEYFEEGLKLVKVCDEKLKEYEEKVQQLLTEQGKQEEEL